MKYVNGVYQKKVKPSKVACSGIPIIMALGRLSHMMSSYGPCHESEGFAISITDMIWEIETKFRRTNDLTQLEKDIWKVRTIAKDYRDLLEDTLCTRDGSDPLCPTGHTVSHGSDMKGDYKVVRHPMADDMMWVWEARVINGAKGWVEFPPKWKDIHEDFRKNWSTLV